ncbi:MAG: hypothetical protein ACHQ5A_08365 [Opitutales bacterium]
MKMWTNRHYLLIAALCLGAGSSLFAGSATNITGLYYTGVNSSYGLLPGGTTDSNWSVSYASTGGSTNTTYEGAAYVVSSSYIDAGWVQNTSSAQWIVPPGAKTAATGGTANVGGDYLPGNGTSGTNTAQFTYTLAFTITGTGSGTVTNNVSISLTIAADDQYKVYMNPALNSNGSVKSTDVASATGLSAWGNTTSITLTNYGSSPNANFVIGTNYLTIVVDNTNSVTGSSSSTAWNPSGLMVYQVGSAMTIDGHPVPEAGTWLPLAGGLGIILLLRYRRRSVPEGGAN